MGSPSVPYIVRQGDYLLRIAERLGVDASEVWGFDENSGLRDVRRSMHILSPGDVVRVPGTPAGRRHLSLTSGATGVYVARVPEVPVSIKLQLGGQPLANEKCTVSLPPGPKELATDGDGVLTFNAPVTLTGAVVYLPRLGSTFSLQLGHLDPPETRSGIAQRLRHLGFLRAPVVNLEIEDDVLEAAVRAFQHACMPPPATGVLDDATRAALVRSHGS